MNTQPSVSKEMLAQDFKRSLQGKLEDEQLNDAANAMLSSQGKYAANGSVASAIFYLRFQVTIKGGKTFNGNAGGISSPGGGALFGDVYTDDLNALYANTHSFSFQSTPVYLSIQFFDKHSKLLGHFQSGAVSTVSGTGGGTGHWS